MKCPKCQVDLVISDRQGVEIDFCPQCRGVWLDRGELDKITERATDTGDEWAPTVFPTEFLSLGTSGIGVPVRATISSFGPIL